MSSNDRTSGNWEGVVLSGWQRSENLIACHGIQRQIQMGIWHKPKLANLLVNVFCQNLFGLMKFFFIVLIFLTNVQNHPLGLDSCKEKGLEK